MGKETFVVSSIVGDPDRPIYDLDKMNPVQRGGLSVVIKRGDEILKTFALANYAETTIITHAGRVDFVKTTLKEKVE